jgi:two-component system response regulator DevR
VTADGRITVFLVDDHEVVREGLRHLLEVEGDVVVVGEAATARDAIELIPRLAPQVAVLDVRLPDGNGVEVCREIRSVSPTTACLMLTSFTDDEALLDAIMAGAAGYVLKEVRGSDLLAGVRRVAGGESIIDAELGARALARARSVRPGPSPGLTPQESRILDLLAEGLTNRQIGDAMYLSEKTVKNYVSHLLAKLGMSRRTEAAVYAVRRQEPPDTRRPRN